MLLVSYCSCLYPIRWSQVLRWEWRCSWSSVDRRCSNYIWVINNLIAYWSTSYIRDLTVVGISLQIYLYRSVFRCLFLSIIQSTIFRTNCIRYVDNGRNYISIRQVWIQICKIPTVYSELMESFVWLIGRFPQRPVPSGRHNYVKTMLSQNTPIKNNGGHKYQRDTPFPMS